MNRLVADWRSSNLNQKEYCQSIGMNPNTFRYWVAKDNKGRQKELDTESAFLPVSPLKMSQQESPSHLSIHYPNGVEVQVPASIAWDMLHRLILLD